VARYWGLASLVDKYVGQILDHIDALGLAGNTIIVFTSDHGDMMGEHRLVHKAVQFEGAVRVPLVIRVPGLRPRRLTTPVSHVSLLATLLDLLGQRQPDHLQGRTLLPLLLGGDSVPDDEDVVIEWNGTSGYTGVLAIPVPAGISEDELRRLRTLEARTIRRGRWKLTVNVSGEHELYDLRDDPGETHNAYFDVGVSDARRSLYQHLIEWQRETNDPLALPPPTDDAADADDDRVASHV
jgi:arylsulfatase A-like enzyme